MSEAGPAQRDLVLDGGEALRRGAWAEAREYFEAALQERQTPQALEGLGMAAQWLVDRETVFVARERAYRLYREGQSRRDAARVAVQLGWDYRALRGEEAVAAWAGSGRLRLPQSFHRRVPGVWASVLDGNENAKSKLRRQDAT